MTKKSKIIISITSVVLTILFAFLLTYIGVLNNKANSYKNMLNATYENSFYSLSDETNNIETTLSKLNHSNSTNMQEKYLTELVSLCQAASNDLSSLPLDHTSLLNTHKFLNQLGGFAFSLKQNLENGNNLSEEDLSQCKQLYASSTKINDELKGFSKTINGSYFIVDHIKSNANKDFGGKFNLMFDDIVKYPTLIYDGPFSDSLEQKQVLGIEEKELTLEEAKAKVCSIFDGYLVSFDGKTTSKDFETYNFSLEKDGLNGYVQITKKGGLILSYYKENKFEEVKKSILDCEFIASSFAEKLGFSNTKIVWSEDNNSCVYCNLCYVKDGIIFYPDMIKVKVCRQSGDVIGFEASSWAYNHTERKNLTAKHTESKAREKLSKNLEEISCNLCVIPNELKGETLAWEFKCYGDESIYYVYINANTLNEEKILKVVSTQNGSLLV